MAVIKANAGESIYRISRFYGLNENPDGDTKLKEGEASVMRNFCVTRDGNLKKRGGTRTVAALSKAPVAGLWSGEINGRKELLAASGDRLWRVWDDESGEYTAEELGYVSCENRVHFFPFGGRVYVMDGTQYLSYDGTMLDSVDGYRPLVSVTVPPAGGGEILEQVNKLCGSRRAWFSPDGESRVFMLPEKNIKSLDYAKDNVRGEYLPKESYTADLAAGSVSFSEIPAEGVNTIEIGWSVSESDRAAVEKMRFSELYNGTQDSRVFLYGDGSSRALYSGIDYDGRPRADYFPDLNIVDVGDENTPITGMIRHFSRLMVFKSESAWSIAFGLTAMADGSESAAFYVTPVNRSIGSAAMGQVQLVLNSPRTLYGADVYEWKNSSAYSAAVTADERQAKRISDRVYATLGDFSLEDCFCFDDNPRQEYYICCGDRALVHNYAADAWYEYTGLSITGMVSFMGETVIGTADGRVKILSEKSLSDDGRAIDARWESGSMSFGSDCERKYSAVLWVGTKPQDSGEVTVTVQTDRKSRYSEKLISSDLSSFKRMNFAALSFRTGRKPMMARLRIKAKKFVFYKLIFENNTADKAATVLSADIRVRATGSAK